MRKLFFVAAFVLTASPLGAQSLPSVTVGFDVTDQNLLVGIAYAAGLYNAERPNEAPLTSAQYAAMIGGTVVKSWARQKFEADFQSGTITKTQRDAKFAEIDKLP